MDGYNYKMWVRNYFFDVRFDIGVRINPVFMIGCIYKSERTLVYDIIYIRWSKISVLGVLRYCTLVYTSVCRNFRNSWHWWH